MRKRLEPMKEVILLGDVEMGAGTLTDDFISDRTLAKLIGELRSKKYPVDLVFNGDTFDFLKCPYIRNWKVTYPRHITVEISLQKLRAIERAHQKVFSALEKFLAKKGNNLYFNIGNHDHDLFHKEVQKELAKMLKAKGNLHFQIKYQQNGVYAEHGHQYDFVSRANLSQLYLVHNDKMILNLPWVSLGMMSRMMYLKEEHPFMERITPYPLLFSFNRLLLHRLIWEVSKYLLMSFFYYPFRYRRDPTYIPPKWIVREFFRRVRNVHWDVDKISDIFKRRKKKALRENKVIVLGHVHEKMIEESGEWAIIQPDTWRDEYMIDQKSRKLYPKSKSYVRVTVEDGLVKKWCLEEVGKKRSELSFREVLKDEKRFLHLAADEEGYDFYL
jgi:UDP-2,3-diacylglucosamine pyrophosphatase LpxH